MAKLEPITPSAAKMCLVGVFITLVLSCAVTGTASVMAAWYLFPVCLALIAATTHVKWIRYCGLFAAFLALTLVVVSIVFAVGDSRRFAERVRKAREVELKH
ncbi:MAG: hypothetical protein K1X78_13535 [Verrucomicrobiaceae bacterium]|nr:hypothetical protein [Verrucomicrobiaceae bacterium]